MNDSRITVVSPDRLHLAEVERIIQKLDSATHVTAVESTLQGLRSAAPQLATDILIVDCIGADGEELAPLEKLGQRHPAMRFIILCRQKSADFLIKAMRLGVRDVLESPVDGAALEAALERVQARTAPAERKAGKVLAFFSCKGGSGATFLASNLAYALATHCGQNVALFDFNLQFGDALLFLTEHKAKTTLTDVVRDMHRLDAGFLASSMMNAAPGLTVLAAPEDPAHGMEVKPGHIDALLKLARREYDYVIVDVGRTLDAPTIRTLDHADTICAVLQTTLPFVRGAKRMLEVFRTLDYPHDKVQLIVNRYEKNGELGIKDLEAILGVTLGRVVPNHYEAAAASVNQGIPVARLAPSSSLARSLLEWSEQLESKPAPVSAGGWFTRILKRA